MCANSSVGTVQFSLNLWSSKANYGEETQPTAHALGAVSYEGALASAFLADLSQELILPMCQWWAQHHHPKCLWLAKASGVSGLMLLPSKQRVVCMWLASWVIWKGEVITKVLCESSSSQITQLDGTRRLCSVQTPVMCCCFPFAPTCGENSTDT